MKHVRIASKRAAEAVARYCEALEALALPTSSRSDVQSVREKALAVRRNEALLRATMTGAAHRAAGTIFGDPIGFWQLTPAVLLGSAAAPPWMRTFDVARMQIQSVPSDTQKLRIELDPGLGVLDGELADNNTFFAWRSMSGSLSLPEPFGTTSITYTVTVNGECTGSTMWGELTVRGEYGPMLGVSGGVVEYPAAEYAATQIT